MGTVTTGVLLLEGWSGRTEQLVNVIGRTPKRLRIQAITETRLAGRRRVLRPGETALVPIHAIRIKPQ